MSQYSDTLVEAGTNLIRAVNQFILNEDYKKVTLIDKSWTKDENGNKIYKEEVRVVETSVIRIDELKKASDIITRLAKAVKGSKETTNGGKSEEQKSKDFQTAMSIENQLTKLAGTPQKELSLYRKHQLARKSKLY